MPVFKVYICKVFIRKLAQNNVCVWSWLKIKFAKAMQYVSFEKWFI